MTPSRVRNVPTTSVAIVLLLLAARSGHETVPVPSTPVQRPNHRSAAPTPVLAGGRVVAGGRFGACLRAGGEIGSAAPHLSPSRVRARHRALKRHVTRPHSRPVTHTLWPAALEPFRASYAQVKGQLS